MTLGGLALAVGILVDDATVTIENINYHLEQGKDVETAILDGAHQIALPALVSTLSICIVFVPMFLLAGIANSCSSRWRRRWCSRCWPPTCCRAPWCRRWPNSGSRSTTRSASGAGAARRASRSASSAASSACASAIMRCSSRRSTAGRASPRCFSAPWPPPRCSPFRSARCPGSGRISSRRVDGGQIKLHLRARTGTRIEETAALCDRGRGDDPRNHSRQARSPPSSTTSACPTAASICRTAPRRRSAPAMRTSIVNLTEDHSPDGAITCAPCARS